MKDEDIKLPELPEVLKTSANQILAFKNSGLKAMLRRYAREAVRMNVPSHTNTTGTPRPFDLEAAKRGECLVTRAGRNARFIAHVPDAAEDLRIVYMVEGCACPKFAHEDGLQFFEGWSDDDLFMAPKPKRTVYVNLYREEDAHKGFITVTWFEDAIAAREFAPASKALVVAYPVEIDAD